MTTMVVVRPKISSRLLLRILIPMIGTLCHAGDGIPLEIDAPKSNQIGILEKGGGEIELTTLGNDPFLVLRPFNPADVSPNHTVLALEYFSPDGVDGLSVHYGPPLTGAKSFAVGKLDRSESWLPRAIDLKTLSGGRWTRKSRQLRLDFGRTAGITLRIRNLRLRQPTDRERESAAARETELKNKLAREARVNRYFATKFPGQIDSVVVNDAQVVVRGKLDGRAGNARLIEIRPEVSAADQGTLENGIFTLSERTGVGDEGPLDADGEFEMTLPRIEAEEDRSTSRWAVAEPLPDFHWKLLSRWKYPTDLSAAAANDLPRQVPKGIKGMGGVAGGLPLDELVELGVHNITLNILLSGIIEPAPRRGWNPFPHGGRTWYVNPGRLAAYDKITKFAEENEIVASGILLVNFSESEFGKMIVHPEADRAGHYGMPNLFDAEGVAAYEAVIECLSRRYSAPGSPHGRISNWIIHNEVGFGWEWTNMGTQPPMLYMDHYIRSMRLVHNVTRRHDPHSRVFISLTHHWNNPADPSWKSYRNVDLLNRLAESSHVEGDFAWGVAFHPYPQDLRKPDTWNDTRVTDDFNTPMITPKNIAVLDRWMQRPGMRDAAGGVRGVLLSEQGFNTPDYSMESQRLQAAGFVYMWRQMEGLKCIEAFHNHRWVDSADEGGLLLGLRKLPEKGKLFGEKKFGWDIYRALDTPTEKEATRFADEIIAGK